MLRPKQCRVLLVILAILAISCSASTDRLSFHKISSSNLRGASEASTLTEPERYSGYFKLNRTYDAHMFFFYFEAREAPADAPVVLWMTDVDQPIGTGFSYSEDDRDRCYDEDCVSNDVLDFLEALWTAKPELQGKDFYVTGESYAGHYVPAVAHRVYQAIKNKELGNIDINLQGFAIGNGLTNPAIQYGAYADYAVEHNLISSDTRDEILQLYPACKLGLEICDGLDFSMECALAVTFCQATMFMPIMLLNPLMNVYDITKECQGPLCYDFSRLDKYMNLPETRKALGVRDDSVWQECNMDVHEDMMSDWAHDFSSIIPEMLSGGVRALIYAGDQDFICNVLGNRRWVDSLQWDQWREWANAENVTWATTNDEDAGVVTEVGPLTFLSVKGAGHMVPMDKGENALEMITKFTRGEKFVDNTSCSGNTRAAVATVASSFASARAFLKGDGSPFLRAGRKDGSVVQK
ncbi:hypothetical protein KSW81_004492 [Nannochloris sp. 'desiccata']|nr:hypothetical protein KSW81_004492 [Chlorella desiccata (nom. nud.)]